MEGRGRTSERRRSLRSMVIPSSSISCGGRTHFRESMFILRRFAFFLGRFAFFLACKKSLYRTERLSISDTKVFDRQRFCWGKIFSFTPCDVFCWSPGSGDLWYRSAASQKTICSRSQRRCGGDRSRRARLRVTNIAHIRQSRPDSGLGFKVKGLKSL